MKCDQITSIPIGQLHEPRGFLLDAQQLAVHEAIQAAFHLVNRCWSPGLRNALIERRAR
ncbi:MAG: hypothetical protein JWO22_2816 [Frankiales bacterium]|nr:hypothetical protein [Frankiales bacterium]